MIHDTETHPIPQGNIKTWRTSQSRQGGTNPILRWSVHLSREVILESTHVGMKEERKLCSECFIVLGGLNFLKKVLGALNSHGAKSTGLSKSARGTSES